MATIKQYLDLSGLTLYDTLIKRVISGKADINHTHAISGVTGLQDALDAKAAASALTQLSGAVETVEDDLAELSGTVEAIEVELDNVYTKAEIDGAHLTISKAINALSGDVKTLDEQKASKDHTHAISGVTGLQAALDEKAAASALTQLSGAVVTVEDDLAELSGATATGLGDRYTKSEADGKFQLLSNLTTAVTSSSTDVQYPSAKAVYTALSAATSGLEPRVAKLESDMNTVSGDVQTLKGDVTSLGGRVSDIEDLIPNEASTENKLADKDFVNSSIATATATFRGTWHITSDLGLPAVSGESWDAVAEALNDFFIASGITADKNDYTFVYVPGHDYKSGETTVHLESRFDRYKFTVTGAGTGETKTWEYEYSLNNSSFTEAQWKALNSGINSEKVSDYDTHIADTTIHVTATEKDTWNGKLDKTAFDTYSAATAAEIAAKASASDLQTLSGSVQTLETSKADKATKLSGYGITDATITAGTSGSTITLGTSTVEVYSTTQIDSKFGEITSIPDSEIEALFQE